MKIYLLDIYVTSPSLLDTIGAAKYVSLTTFRSDGEDLYPRLREVMANRHLAGTASANLAADTGDHSDADLSAHRQGGRVHHSRIHAWRDWCRKGRVVRIGGAS